MDIDKRLQLSYYKTIATLNDEHKVYIVQDSRNKHVYIKKILDIYNIDVYNYLYANHINGMPYIYEVYQEENTLTIIEEYISGRTLEELLIQKHVFSTDEIKNIIWQLCTILNQLHRCKPAIIHRDLKPSNIILTEDGKVYLLDLNAAKHYSSDKNEDTTLLGTKGYAAPEQYGFGTSNPQTDIYALGMVINTLLCGEFSPVAYTYDKTFTPIIAKCTKLQPEKRYKSVAEIKKHLRFEPPSKMDEYQNYYKFLPPGFRRLNPFNILASGIVYAITIWLCLTLEVKDSTPITLLIERIFLLIMFFGAYFIAGNYLGIQKKFPLCRANNMALRILGAVIYVAIYMFAVAMLMLSLCTMLS